MSAFSCKSAGVEDLTQHCIDALQRNCDLHACIFVRCQQIYHARWLQHLFPELGQDLQERAYGSDCRLYIPEEKRVNWEVIKGTVFDEFVIAHTVGWWCAPCCATPAACCSRCHIKPSSSSALRSTTGCATYHGLQLPACFCC